MAWNIFSSHLRGEGFESENIVYKMLFAAAPQVAPYLAFILLVPAPICFLILFRKKKLLDKQKDLNSIRSISWKEFEELVAEAYRRKGYSVVENDGAGPDGGIDLILRKDGNLFLVQCKQWKSSKVNVQVVREMYCLIRRFRHPNPIHFAT
jgi:restriction system protein